MLRITAMRTFCKGQFQAGHSLTKAWTVHAWFVKKGRDQDFISAWQDFAHWMTRQGGSGGTARLFRDVSGSSHYMSVDSWEDIKSIKTMRRKADYKNHMSILWTFLEDYSSWPLKLEVEESSKRQG
jgi:hypothetical protein